MGNYGQENIQGISFEIFPVESRIFNTDSDTLTHTDPFAHFHCCNIYIVEISLNNNHFRS